MLSISITVPPAYKTKTQGLLGVFDDNKSNDLTAFGGTVVPVTATESEIYNQFGMTCKLLTCERILITGP